MASRVCVTRARKRAIAALKGRPTAGPRAAPAGPLFRGRLYVVALTAKGPASTWSLAKADLASVVAYLERAVVPIAAYAGQYGPVGLSVEPAPVPLSVTLADASYSDADLQGWVDSLAGSLGLRPDAAVLFLNPPGLTNTDARESGGVGVLGYHGLARIPYSFVNVLGRGFSLADPADLYAEAVSHEIAEMTVDPQANDQNPEVCDGCGTNCLGPNAYRSYFDVAGGYLGSASTFPPGFPYAFFVSAVARPSAATDCPAPGSACAYAPPGMV